MAKTVNKKSAAEKVKPRDLVTIKWKGAKFNEDGKTSQVHATLAEKFIKQGKAEKVEAE